MYTYLCMHLKCHQAYPSCHIKNRSEHSKKGSVLYFWSTALLNYDSQTSYFTVLIHTTYSSNNSAVLNDCKSVAREQKNHWDLLKNTSLINILCGCVCICVHIHGFVWQKGFVLCGFISRHVSKEYNDQVNWGMPELMVTAAQDY